MGRNSIDETWNEKKRAFAFIIVSADGSGLSNKRAYLSSVLGAALRLQSIQAARRKPGKHIHSRDFRGSWWEHVSLFAKDPPTCHHASQREKSFHPFLISFPFFSLITESEIHTKIGGPGIHNITVLQCLKRDGTISGGGWDRTSRQMKKGGHKWSRRKKNF